MSMKMLQIGSMLQGFLPQKQILVDLLDAVENLVVSTICEIGQETKGTGKHEVH